MPATCRDAGRLGEVRGDPKFTAGAAITHALVHGQYHRAQAVNMLRRLNVRPLPGVDVMDWHHEEDFQQ